ncbi:hypothetical protein IQ270_00090 [Microcoleus sp. LEGE 07076]|uniref:hypothetical protein n=1 Tax=Microcoleus sp. LEGE 07076 TaxID=915322 RepID=UPI00187FB09E|nr:hypothetical protein [Microcoleus sp. LEGE 07076]MBE9183164.1 hypothetical protein [Microcoleus sp. LEGE 07076]
MSDRLPAMYNVLRIGMHVLDRRRTEVLTTNHFYDGYMTGHDVSVGDAIACILQLDDRSCAIQDSRL